MPCQRKAPITAIAQQIGDMGPVSYASRNQMRLPGMENATAARSATVAREWSVAVLD